MGVVGLAPAIAIRFTHGPGAAPVARIVALAVLSVAPLALAVSAVARAAPRRTRLLVAGALPVCAVCAVLSLYDDSGGAWPLAIPWLVVAGSTALLGRPVLYDGAAWRDPARLSDALALVFFPVGAAWLVVSRAGLAPFGLPATIVELTIVHFHYAALAGLVLSARAIAATRDRPRVHRAASLAGLGVAVAIPIVAAGITASPAVGLAGAVLLAGSLLLYAVVSLAFVVRNLASSLARVLAVTSALSLLLSMPLAILYSWGEATGDRIVLLDTMVHVHGFANAHGFVVCGLLAWIVEDRRRAQGQNGLVVPE